MYVSYIQGVPDHWGHPRDMLHYTSPDMLEWKFVSKISLSSGNVIDACIYPLPDGGFRMWYKDEGHHSHLYAMRRTSIQVAKLEVVDGVLYCDRNKEFELNLGADD